MISSLRQFGTLCDRYYWQTAVLIARNGLARQYRNSFLGIFWTLLQPLTQVMVYTIIMPHLMRFPGTNYALYIIISLPLWNFFAAVLVEAKSSIIANGEVLKRCIISSTVFPVADVLRQSYMYMVSFGCMYVVALLFVTSFSPTVLLVPLYFIPILMIMGSIAIAVAFIAPYVRDIGELVWLCMTMLVWLTPVVYPITALPLEFQAWMQWNPFFIMMHPIQVLVFEQALPGLDDTMRLLALTLIAILVGFGIFRICRRNYVYYL